ncbi:MAG: Rieske (2Fe-2S) protein [Chlorobi bacterium]|nr:Rieske (2Fe-2S) protein [Chlorobiota bacterium]
MSGFLKKTFSAFALIVLFSTCDNSYKNDIIPNVSFYVKIYLDDPKYADNTFIVTTDNAGNRAGINGVVVYRLSSDTYYAFDLMCPNEKQVSCLVTIENDVTCRCPCCNSEFLIGTPYGDVISGDAPWPLKAYKTRVSGGGTLLEIWN